MTLSWLNNWLAMMQSTVKNGDDHLQKGNWPRRVGTTAIFWLVSLTNRSSNNTIKIFKQLHLSRIVVVLSLINRFGQISEERCERTDRHGRHIYRTTFCWNPGIFLPWQWDVTTSFCSTPEISTRGPSTSSHINNENFMRKQVMSRLTGLAHLI